MPLTNKALMATPIKSNTTIDLDELDFDNKNTKKVPKIPPKQANKGKENSLIVMAKVFPSTMKNAAPKAAPLDVPIIPGSTIGFLNKDCTKIPPTAKVAPTKTLNKVLGKRISIKILSFNAIDGWFVNSFVSAFIISLNVILTAP